MADGVVHMVSRLPSISGLSADAVQNVINCGVTTSAIGSEVTTAMEAFRDFYIEISGAQGTSISTRLSDSLSRGANACQILAYFQDDLDGSDPMGSPIDMLNFTLDAGAASTDLPEEVAIVISYNADLTDVPVSEANPSPPPATIRPAARRRGRMYIGPLNDLAGGAGAGGFYRPSATMLGDLAISFDRMAGEINATTQLELGIWSKADAEVYTAVAGKIDDAWDTQRRRGVLPTTAQPFTL